MKRWIAAAVVLVIGGIAGFSCSESSDAPTTSAAETGNQSSSPSSESATAVADTCELVQNGAGAAGTTQIRVDKIVTGLTVPWGIVFISPTDYLVTERPGRVRLVRNGVLQSSPVLSLNVVQTGEAGLLGITIHPQFASNRLFYVYYTVSKNGTNVNRVERYRLSQEGMKAQLDRLIIDDIPAANLHAGGRIKFGPDGLLYIGTGDARNPGNSQDKNSLAGKVLRLTPDGTNPGDNPFLGGNAFVFGVRNTQAFDWYNSSLLIVGDHGPTGDLGRTGGDEINLVPRGANLGWSTAWLCQEAPGVTRPLLAWQRAVPPGGLVYYKGDAIPAWKGSALVATLGSQHLHRVMFEEVNGEVRLTGHEVYLQGTYGRLREVVQAPDGSLYVTTSNCDGRGTCPADRDVILRITSGP